MDDSGGKHFTPFPRFLRPRVEEALADTPVVLISGPRQAGKTTLAKTFCGKTRPYLTLDDDATRLAARADPQGFLRKMDYALIDEVQRVPELILAIKKTVDEDRRPGRFLITGSANLLTIPTVADSLAGRMEILPLLPLSQCEMHPNPGGSAHWLDAVFSKKIPRPIAPETGDILARRVFDGGYPEAVGRTTERRRRAWAEQYVDTLIRRDIHDIFGIEKSDHLKRLLFALAQVSGQLCNYSALAGQIGFDQKTAAKYLSVFEQLFLLRRLPPYAANGLGRLVKTPKVEFLDSGLLATCHGVGTEALFHDKATFGRLLETFVFSELTKRLPWSEGRYGIFFHRDKDMSEVDFILENPAGDIVGIEVKSGATLRQADFAPLRKLAAATGRAFRTGIVLYDGEHTLPMGDDLWAVPLSTLASCTLETA